MPVVDPGERVYVEADGDRRVTVVCAEGTLYYGTQSVTASSNEGSLTTGDDLTIDRGTWFFSTDGASFSQRDASTEGSVESVAVTPYAGSGSHQQAAYDLELAAGAGTSAQGDTSFLAGVMGNLLGSALTATHNFVAGVIGAYSVDTSNATDLQAGGVVGVVMDGAADSDGAVVAVIDGGDPSTETHTNAMFAARVNNNHADTSATYGLDLFDAGRDETLYTGGGVPLAVDNADIRLTSGVCILSGAGAPTNGTTGDNFAEKGSLYVDVTNGVLYINTGAITNPTWVKVGTQS